jgi:hypothetical protein
MRKRKPRIKVIKVTGRIDLPDDPSYPYKLVVSLIAPDMGMGYILQYGNWEQFVVRGKTPSVLGKFVKKNKLEENSRFRKWEVTDSTGKVVWSVRQR